MSKGRAILPGLRGFPVAARVALVLAAALLLADILTIAGTPWTSTTALGGWDLALSGGCVLVRAGGGFERTGEVQWQGRAPRRWLPSTEWYSISGMLNWRETHVPLWLLWGGALGAAAFGGPIGRWRRGRRGECAGCGYPRAGLKAGARCPECGEGARNEGG